MIFGRYFLMILLSLMSSCSIPDLHDPKTLHEAKKKAILLSELNKEFMYSMIWLYVDDDNDTFTGWVKETYPNQSLKNLGYFKNGQKQGLWLAWHKNKKTASKIEWNKDRLSGNYVHWYENGNLHASGQTVYGEMDGEWKEYYKNGQLQAHSLTQMGKCIWKKIRKIDGEVCAESTVSNGQGEFIEYDEDGNRVRKRIFKEGVEIKLSSPQG